MDGELLNAQEKELLSQKERCIALENRVFFAVVACCLRISVC